MQLPVLWRKGLQKLSMRTQTSCPDGPDWGWTVQEAGRTADFLYGFILDGPDLLDRPSGPSGALTRV